MWVDKKKSELGKIIDDVMEFTDKELSNPLSGFLQDKKNILELIT